MNLGLGSETCRAGSEEQLERGSSAEIHLCCSLFICSTMQARCCKVVFTGYSGFCPSDFAKKW